jgi:hypothetical protein
MNGGNMLNQEQAQQLCDKWADLFKVGSWKFTVELKDDGPIQFKYNYQTGIAVLEITYKEVTEETIVSMLVDFALLYRLLPQLKEDGEQYIDHDNRNIKEIVSALLALSKEEQA